jgi:hypothetical protein
MLLFNPGIGTIIWKKEKCIIRTVPVPVLDKLSRFDAGFRIRIRIGSVFNRASGSRRAKMTHKSGKNW